MVRIRDLEDGIIRAEHETEFWRMRFRDLETQFLRLKQVELQKFELEEAYEVCKGKYYVLSGQLEEKKMECIEFQSKLDDLILRKINVGNELKKQERMSIELKERIKHLEEEQKVVCEREERAKERIAYLEEENKKMGASAEREKYVELVRKDLECGKRRAVDEIEVWKRKYCELETQAALILKHGVEMERELENYRIKCHGLSVELEEKNMAGVAIEDKLKDLMTQAALRLKHEVEMEKELENYRIKCHGLSVELEEKKMAGVAIEDKLKDLMTQAALRLKHEVEMEKELENYWTKCRGLSVELEEKKMAGVAIEDKLKDLILRKNAFDDELKGFKTMCNGQKERIMLLEKDQYIFKGREKSAQERITHLLKELKKRESHESERNVQLKTEMKNLESGKRRAENRADFLKKRFRELEAQVLRLNQVELKKSELEKELEVYKTQCHALRAELGEKKIEFVAVEGKLKDLQLSKIEVDDELKEYKTTCNATKELIMRLEEDQKVICGKEKKAQERIAYLEEEIKKMESYVREKYVELKTENRDLECGKRRAQDEIEIWNKRYKELETRFLRLEEESSTLRCKNLNSHVSENIELKVGGLQNEVSYDDEGRKNKNNTLQSENYNMTDGAHGKMLGNSSFAGCNHPSSLQGNRSVHIAGSPSVNMQSEPVENAAEEKNNSPLKSKVDFGTGVRKHLVFELEMSSSEKLVLLEKGGVRPAFGDIVKIGDSENEEESAAKHTCNIGGKQTVHVSTDNTLKRCLDNRNNLASNKCLKKPCSDMRGEEHRSSYEEDIPLSSNPKIRRSSQTVASESESEDDDRIPIGKLMIKKLEELNKRGKKLSPLNLCSGSVTRSSECHVENSISPSGRRLISLKQCEEKKNWGERKFSNESTSPNYFQMSEISNQKAGNPTSENGKEKLVEDVAIPTSLSVCESLSGCSDSGDSSSDSEDARDIDLAFSQVIAMIKRNRLKESGWKFEADMLSSFEEDSELCMKAVCALYRLQLLEKKLMKCSSTFNSWGINKYDALRVAILAQFLMDGDQGDLKKSLRELEMFDPKALEECKRLAKQYSKQLFTIYQNKEDPFFLPSSDQAANSGRMQCSCF